jgi:NAD(P)-dependent dehydrogenase (short-subunit alcohol dehydrogenase family)
MQSTTKIAIITGAGSGVGRCAALALARAGFQVVLAGRRSEKLAETVSLLAPPLQAAALPVTCDVTDPESVQQLFETTRGRYGRVDLLFNNAGTNLPATAIEEVKLEDWNAVLGVNLTGMFLCTQAAIRLMKIQRPMGGRIINNGSISAHVPRPQAIAYNVTKHAVTGMTKSTSLDGRKYNIACGQIDIGNADTNMAAKMKKGVLQASGELAVEPTIDPEIVAQGVVYMASLPLAANVQFMTVMATAMPYIGRG